MENESPVRVSCGCSTRLAGHTLGRIVQRLDLSILQRIRRPIQSTERLDWRVVAVTEADLLP